MKGLGIFVNALSKLFNPAKIFYLAKRRNRSNFYFEKNEVPMCFVYFECGSIGVYFSHF